MTALPHLSDDEKQKLCERLEGWGLLRRDECGRWRCTTQGHLAGCMLYAVAAFEEAEKREAASMPTVQ